MKAGKRSSAKSSLLKMKRIQSHLEVKMSVCDNLDSMLMSIEAANDQAGINILPLEDPHPGFPRQ